MSHEGVCSTTSFISELKHSGNQSENRNGLDDGKPSPEFQLQLMIEETSGAQPWSSAVTSSGSSKEKPKEDVITMYDVETAVRYLRIRHVSLNIFSSCRHCFPCGWTAFPEMPCVLSVTVASTQLGSLPPRFQDFAYKLGIYILPLLPPPTPASTFTRDRRTINHTSTNAVHLLSETKSFTMATLNCMFPSPSDQYPHVPRHSSIQTSSHPQLRLQSIAKSH